MHLAAVVGWSGVVVGTLTNGAQARRIGRQGPDGVNATTWSLFTMMTFVWLAYGASVGSPEVVASALCGLPFLVVLLARLDPTTRWRSLTIAAGLLGVVVGVPTAALGWDAGLLGLGGVIVLTRLPQLRQLVWARHADGVSTGSWLLGSLNVGLWLVFYATTHHAVAAATMGIAMATNLSIVGLAVLRHRQGSTRPSPADELALAA